MILSGLKTCARPAIPSPLRLADVRRTLTARQPSGGSKLQATTITDVRTIGITVTSQDDAIEF